MLDRLFALETFGIKLGLSNIQALCEALGHPERAFATLHVGGTNGKGSVTAMAHAALGAAGLRAARYTSPHLVDLRERFVIGDAAVGDDELETVASAVLDCADALQARGTLAAPPTFFEATTAIAFGLFRRAGVEVAVVEVGLGGRFDATNVITPMAVAITSVGLDHQQHLGSTLPAIAFEKAGIIKPGVPVVAGALPPEAAAVVRRVAAEREAPLIEAAGAVALASEMEDGRARVTMATPAHRYPAIRLALRGEHQVDNALVAVRLLETARARGLAVPFEAIAHGLCSAEWPARLEMIETGGGCRVLLDAAHNADGAAALARYLARWHPEKPPLVLAVMRDKDAEGMLRALLPAVGRVVATAPPSARARPPMELAEAIRQIDPARTVVVEPDAARAVSRACEQARLVCVAGSIFLAGAVRGALRPRAIVDSSP